MNDIVYHHLLKLIPGTFIDVSRKYRQLAIDVLMARQFLHPCREMFDTLKILDSVSSSLTRKFVGNLNAHRQFLADHSYEMTTEDFMHAMKLLEFIVPCFLNAQIGWVVRSSFKNLAFCSSFRISAEMARFIVRAMLIHFPDIVIDYLYEWHHDMWVMNSRHKILTTTCIDVIRKEYDSLVDNALFSKIELLVEEYDETLRTFEQDAKGPWYQL